jgi:hypothetical protein
VQATFTRGNGSGGARLQTAGVDVVGFGHGGEAGEASDSGGEAVGFGPSLSGRAREATSGRRRSDRPGRDVGLPGAGTSAWQRCHSAWRHAEMKP